MANISDVSPLLSTGLKLAGVGTPVVAVATMLAPAALEGAKAIFSSSGVDASFFDSGIGSLLSGLDNSTLHWKSRLSGAKKMTPAGRLANWYGAIASKNWHIDDACQYNLLFTGNWTDKKNVAGDFQGDDTPYLTVQLCQLWNTLLDQKYFRGQDVYPNSVVAANYEYDGTKYLMHGSNGNGTGVYNKDNLFLDVTKASDYEQVLQQLQQEQESSVNNLDNVSSLLGTGLSSSSSSSGTLSYWWLLLLPIFLLFYFFRPHHSNKRKGNLF